ncbi:MAG: tetratricopeptide repeat protein [Chitinophagaceae bacterium]
MSNFSSRQDREEMHELLRAYNNLKMGRNPSFIQEEDFERIIDYYDDKEDLPAAVEAAENAIQQYPYSSALLLKKADLQIAGRKYADALETLNKAELLDSNDINLYILKTDAYLALDLHDDAVHLLEKALQLFEGDERIELLFELADVYDDYEDFQKVFECLKWVLEEDPVNEEALMKICFWADFTGRSEESIKLHLKIIDNYPFNELAWFNLATAYQGIKLYEKAIDAYQYALAIDEKFDVAYRNMGDAFIRIRKYKEAIEALEKVLELSRPEDVIHEAIGHCFHKMNNFAQARFHYRKASHLNPDDSKLHYKIALTYFKEDQIESAVKQLDSAMRILRMHPEYNLLMGECKLQQGKIKDAVIFFSNVVRVRPKNASGWEALIRCLVKAEYFEEAAEQTLHAIEATNGKTLFLFYQSAILFAMGKSKEGMLQLENALQVNPKLLKKFIELQPQMLRNPNVVDLIVRYKGKKGKK